MDPHSSHLLAQLVLRHCHAQLTILLLPIPFRASNLSWISFTARDWASPKLVRMSWLFLVKNESAIIPRRPLSRNFLFYVNPSLCGKVQEKVRRFFMHRKGQGYCHSNIDDSLRTFNTKTFMGYLLLTHSLFFCFGISC